MIQKTTICKITGNAERIIDEEGVKTYEEKD